MRFGDTLMEGKSVLDRFLTQNILGRVYVRVPFSRKQVTDKIAHRFFYYEMQTSGNCVE